MTTDAPRRPAVVAPVTPIPLRSRLVGLGSIFGKAVRDSRRAFVIELLFLGGFLLVICAGIASAYPTQQARDELARLANTVGPAAQGLTGRPVNIGTIGGYVQWKYGPVFLLFAAFWSILSLTGTLAGEARRGSLDVVAAAPFSKRRIAVEKVAAHVTLLTVAIAVMALAGWLAGAAFARLPGDEIPLKAAVGFALWVGLMSLAFGGLAFALSQFLGRAAAAWIAGFVLVAGPILNNYRTLEPAFGGVADLTPAAWTANHLPLAGQYDWVSLAPVAGVAVLLILAGIEAFARRDLGAAAAVRTPGVPPIALGLRDAGGRSFGERLPLALAWGLGLGAFGLIMATGSRSLADQFAASPDLAGTFRRLFPGFDITSAGGFLQLLVQLLYVVAGFAAVTLVSGWATDETAGRLEVVLASPLSRRSWVVRSGLGVLAAIGVMTVVTAACVGLGAVWAGSDVLTPMAGTFALGLFAAAMAGVGFAVGGLVRTSIAAGVLTVIVIATYLIDLLVPALHLPSWVHQLALTAHLGRPMVGHWDAAGSLACLVLAVGGLALGALGFARRDLRS